MTPTSHQTWDQALLRRLRASGRTSVRTALATIVAGVLVSLLPGIARGTTGGEARLYVSDQDNFPSPKPVTLTGTGFVANAPVQIFECPSGATRLRDECAAIGTAVTDADGSFHTDASGTGYKAIITPYLQTPQGTSICRTQGDVQCVVVAATFDPVTLEPTSQAQDQICFQRANTPQIPTKPCDPDPVTTTTTPPPPAPEWEPAAPMATAREHHATAVGADGRIYALGGNDENGTALSSAEVLDPCGSKTWSPLPPMLTARTQFAAAAGPDGRIYAIGGADAVFGTPLATVEAYDPATNQWSPVGSLAVPRYDLVATTGPDGRIYAIGGRPGGGPQSSLVEAYEATANRWDPVAPLLAPRSNHAAVTGLNGRVYALGGAGPVGAPRPELEYYGSAVPGLPATWTPSAATVGLDPDLAAAVAPDGRIYAIGGATDAGTVSVSTMVIYDPQTDKWERSSSALFTPRATHTAAMGRDGRIYAIGGTDDPFAANNPIVTEAPVPVAITEALSVAPNACPRPTPPADFDGNFVTDYSVFRPSTGTWFVKDGLTVAWGTDGDIPVPADYDGDKRVDVAVFRPSTGTWFVKDGATLAYGTSGDVPVPADYDGDGRADIAVFRPSNGVWFIHYSGGGDAAFAWGANGDVAVPADYNGDGRADAAVFRNGVWFVKDGATLNYGTAGDIPVVADYDDDHVADVAVFRPSTGGWYLRDSSHPETPEEFAFGTAGDIPVPGDYDGDRIADPAVFRPDTGTWFVETGATASWGVATDIPLPLPAAVRMSSFT